MFKRFLIASAVVLALGACGSTDTSSDAGSNNNNTDGGNNNNPGTMQNAGACTMDVAGIRFCIDFSTVAATVAEAQTAWQSACTGGTAGAVGTYSASCPAGYNASCNVTNATSVTITRYYTTDATMLSAFQSSCKGTWSTP